MIRAQREERILTMLHGAGAVAIRDLTRSVSGVSEVTWRRDIARLAQQGALSRTRGGARRQDGAAAGPAGHAALDRIGTVDAIVLPPIAGPGAAMLRLRARKRGIPFLAESAPQDGGVYLGPDNRRAGLDLGLTAGAIMRSRTRSARLLLVALEGLPNTRARCDGFLEGFLQAFDGEVVRWRVDGKGDFRAALRASRDALTARRDINVLFGVNDHSVLAALEASDRLGLADVCAFAVGGEGAPLFDSLAADGKLKAAAALFPEVVGARAVDTLATALAGGALPSVVSTPHAIVTPTTLGAYYRRRGDDWRLAADGAALIAEPARLGADLRARTIGFMPHYPAHDWYRGMARAMRERAERYGMELVLAEPSEEIAREIAARRAEIGRAAASRIRPGETVLINAGPVALPLADAIRPMAGVTVVTNALDVMELLADRRGVKVILTSGERHRPWRCLVGPSLGALFESVRIDKAFLSVDGISLRFGVSASDERLALAAWRCVQAARETFALVDSSIVDLDANHRIAPIGAIDEVITDSGSLPADRLAFATAGVRVTLADEEIDENEAPAPRPAGGLVYP